MDKLKIALIVIGIIIGCIIGYFLDQSIMNNQDCKQLEQDNQMLRDMLFNQQDPYRPDTTQQPIEVEGCGL